MKKNMYLGLLIALVVLTNVPTVFGQPVKRARGYAPGLTVIPMTNVTDDEKEYIGLAVPTRPIVPPKKKRLLLIYDVNFRYIGHKAIAQTNYAFQLMGERTGAFTAVISHDPTIFNDAEGLKKYDAIFFNSTVGNSIKDPKAQENILNFVRDGGGFMGTHGTSGAFINMYEPGGDGLPEFTKLLGARGTYHRAKTELVHIKVEQPNSPLAKMLPAEGFVHSDEIFRFRGNDWDRAGSSVLLSIDNEKTARINPEYTASPHERPDHDYAIAWTRTYGKGRVFYCSLAHQAFTFWNPMLLKFYLAGTQYVLGDLELGPVAPAARDNRK